MLYQFIFKLVIPVYLASRKIKKGFRDMQDKMQSFDYAQDQHQEQGYTPQPSASNPEPAKKGGDYIDFEEVK
jgi:hypothetical protein